MPKFFVRTRYLILIPFLGMAFTVMTFCINGVGLIKMLVELPLKTLRVTQLEENSIMQEIARFVKLVQENKRAAVN